MKHITLFCFILALLSMQGVNAQEDFRKTAPKAGPAPKIELGTYEQFELKNGLKVITVENNKIPRVSFQLFIDVPPLKEGEKAGTADLAGQLLSRGTSSKSKAAIDESVDFLGATLNTSASGIFAASLTKHQDKLLAIMADVLMNPSFPKEEFEKLKTQTISNLAAAKDDPNAISGNVANVLRYGKDHPYGELVTEKSVEKITLEACQAYYNTYFKPNISYLVVVGDIKAKAAKEIAEKYFGKWEKGVVTKPAVPSVIMPTETTVDFVGKTGAVQSIIALTYPVELKPGSDDAIKARVMNTLFGGYFRSRLNNNIREDKGYSYGVRSSLSSDRHIGYFSAGGAVRNEVTDSSITEFLKEMKALNVEKVPADELTLVKNVLSGSFARQLESPQTVARFALNTALYNLPKDYYSTYLEKISAVTADDILAMAKKYLNPDKAHILVVGNKDEVAEKLKPFAASGKVNFYDYYGNEEEAMAATPEGIDAATVIDNYIKAIGGKDKLTTVKDMSTKMEASMQGMTLELNTMQKEGKFALTVGMGGMVMQEQKYDGEKGVNIAQGNKQMVEGNDLENLKLQAMLFPELSYADLGCKLELKGIEAVENKKAYKLIVELPTGKKTTEFYDVETGYKIRTVAEEAGTSIITDISDYAEVEGIKAPQTIKLSGMMPVPMIFKMADIAINKGIEDSVFTIE